MNAKRTWYGLLILGVLGNLVGAGAYFWGNRNPNNHPAMVKPPESAPRPPDGKKSPGSTGGATEAMESEDLVNLTALSVWKDPSPKTCEVPWSLAVRRLGPLLEENSDADTTHKLSLTDRYRLLLGLSPHQRKQLESGLAEILSQKRDESKQSARIVEMADGGTFVELAMDHARDRYWMERALALLPKDLSRDQQFALEAALAREPRFMVNEMAVVRVYVEQLSDGAWQHVNEFIGAEGAGRVEEEGPWTPYSFLLPAQERWEAMVRRKKQ